MADILHTLPPSAFARSGVKHHGKLLNSFLGPLSIVAEGEVSDSLVGPFVGFHHQALLIAGEAGPFGIVRVTNPSPFLSPSHGS